MLNHEEFYSIAVELVRRGLLNYLHIGKLLIFGLTRQGPISQICALAVKDVWEDTNESKQLFANFGESIRFILSNPEIDKDVCFHTLTPEPSPLIQSKHEQSLSSLRPTLFKSCCE